MCVRRISAALYLLWTLAAGCFAAARPRQPIDLFTTVRQIPFSFVFAGRSSHQFLSTWKKVETKKNRLDGVEQTLITYSDPQSKLEVICEISWYPQRRAAEWLLRLKNNGDRDSAILEAVHPLDLNVPQPEEETAIFHSAYGTPFADNAD